MNSFRIIKKCTYKEQRMEYLLKENLEMKKDNLEIKKDVMMKDRKENSCYNYKIIVDCNYLTDT